MKASETPNPIFSYNDWEIEAISDDTVKLTLKRVEPPISMIWYADHTIKLWELVRYIEVLERTLAKGELSLCVNDTFYELKRADGEWRLRARGLFNYELVGLDVQQALRLALLLAYAKAEDPIKSDFATAIRLMGLGPLLESLREVRLSGLDSELIMSWRDDKLIIRPIRASPLSEFTTLQSLVEAGVLEGPEVEVPLSSEDFEELMARLLLGELDLEDFEEELVPVRRALARLVVKHIPHEGRVRIRKDKVVVENSYGTWEIDLEDGDLYLNDEHVCVEVEMPMLNVISLPDVGELRLGKVSMKMVASLVVALRPDEVTDPRLRREIERAASSEEEEERELRRISRLLSDLLSE